MTPISKNFVSSRAVIGRYGITLRTLDRWVKAGAFPPPDMIVNGRRYWREATLEQHERKAVGQSKSEPRAIYT